MKFFTILFTLALISCSSSQVTETITASDYTAEKPYFQKWMGGAPGSGSGVNLFIPAYLIEKDSIDAIYFQDMKATNFYFEDEDHSTIVARFINSNTVQTKMTLDPKGEYGNPAPSLEKIDIELSTNEAAIKLKGEKKASFVILSAIEEKPIQQMPGRLPR